MSRVSLSNRLRAIDKAVQAHDPHAYAIYQLPPRLRQLHDGWRDECVAAAELSGRNRYEALLLDGEVTSWPMPPEVRMALFPNGLPDHSLAASATLEEAADAYTKLLERN